MKEDILEAVLTDKELEGVNAGVMISSGRGAYACPNCGWRDFTIVEAKPNELIVRCKRCQKMCCIKEN